MPKRICNSVTNSGGSKASATHIPCVQPVLNKVFTVAAPVAQVEPPSISERGEAISGSSYVATRLQLLPVRVEAFDIASF